MEDNAELESFRREWREEVARRSKPRASAALAPPSTLSVPSPVPPERLPPTRHAGSDRKDLEEEGPPPASFDPEELAQQVGQLNVAPEEEEEDHDEDGFTRRAQQEPDSALEHFERAVEKEAAGNLGDSLQHYRKAYRLDSSVDKSYRNKHFAHVWKKPAQPAPNAPGAPDAPAPVTAPAPTDGEFIPTPALIESFAHLPIPQADPLIENTPPPPCPIGNVPSEVIVEILRHVATRDPATFGRMALVCKRLAYHFAHEQHIWKRICQRPQFGFQGMHYSFVCDVLGGPIYTLSGNQYTPFPSDIAAEIPKPLSSWKDVFQSYPRIRFTGVYISTVNYTRAGATSSFQNVSWNSPIHIVTYYRYLRFYPDGSLVSLLSTTEPVDVVPHISRENVMAARAPPHRQHQRQPLEQGKSLSGATEPVPPVAMAALKYGLRGRWHLTPPIEPSEPATEEQLTPSIPNQTAESFDPRDIVVETEGVDSKYIYTMHLSLRSPSASKSHVNPSQNTKLMWRGFWSYNKITDDWSEFGMRNYRAYVFRRVRGWGLD
ncbi:hypothetical protein N7462_009069 [Penicillium macrosclerotiorum]|uniref:uncharacterized protein n=1 Tax=Penicillium macrosclerotiorum TaxID=303699 RepID=UPI00254785E4|nr:uncharacterized protein N7462_009069 [Penicillium macrosclerotiorum]KAJ5676172.1 hypothetical protein N7462_009069 [Penicillium macrosclerotiorum]